MTFRELEHLLRGAGGVARDNQFLITPHHWTAVTSAGKSGESPARSPYGLEWCNPGSAFARCEFRLCDDTLERDSGGARAGRATGGCRAGKALPHLLVSNLRVFAPARQRRAGRAGLDSRIFCSVARTAI